MDYLGCLGCSGTWTDGVHNQYWHWVHTPNCYKPVQIGYSCLSVSTDHCFSQPIGYKGGIIFASFVAFFIVLIWICSYDKGLDFMRFVGTVMKNLWEYIKDKYSKAKESIKNKCTYASNVWGAAWGRVTKPVALAVVALATHRRDQNENQRSV